MTRQPYSCALIGKLISGLKEIKIPTKDAFFAPAGKDKAYYTENRILSFGNIEMSISPEDEEIFESHFTEYIARHSSHLGFINYLVGGLVDV